MRFLHFLSILIPYFALSGGLDRRVSARRFSILEHHKDDSISFHAHKTRTGNRRKTLGKHKCFIEKPSVTRLPSVYGDARTFDTCHFVIDLHLSCV